MCKSFYAMHSSPNRCYSGSRSTAMILGEPRPPLLEDQTYNAMDSHQRNDQRKRLRFELSFGKIPLPSPSMGYDVGSIASH